MEWRTYLELLEAFFHADVFNVSAHAVLDLEAHGDGVDEGKHLVFGQCCPAWPSMSGVVQSTTERGSAKTNQSNQHGPVILANVFQDDPSSIEPEGHEDGRRREEADADAGHQRAVGLGAHGGRHGGSGSSTDRDQGRVVSIVSISRRGRRSARLYLPQTRPPAFSSHATGPRHCQVAPECVATRESPRFSAPR